MRRVFALLVAVSSLAAGTLTGGNQATDIFSGPQKGEPLAEFTIAGALGAQNGKDFNPVASAKGKPLLLIFVHEVNRPSVGMARLLGDYAAKRRSDGLHGAVVFLTDDPEKTEEWIKRASGALPKEVPLGIFRDGLEGPGEYGLNRKVTMTILLANEGKVTANFALVQPSIQVDAPKVLKSIADLIGGSVPTLEELGAPGARQRRGAERPKAKTEDGK
jgi:hypothetical protein